MERIRSRRLIKATLCLAFFLPPSLQLFPATFIVTKTADTNDGVCDSDCSLREAVRAANASPGANAIQLPSGLYALTILGLGEDLAATGDLDITGDVTITGAGAASTVIDGGFTSECLQNPACRADRVFEVSSGAKLKISGVTIRNGAGGIVNAGTLEVESSIITACKAEQLGGKSDGGGIWSSGAATITSSTISRNRATDRGGGIFNSGTMEIVACAVFESASITEGGGIVNSGVLSIASSTIARNGVEATGGGISNAGGTLLLTRCTISGNDAASTSGGHRGGGIIIGGGSVEAEGTILAWNDAPVGPDLYVGGGSFTSLGHNLFGGAGPIGVKLQPSDLTGDPGLDAFTTTGAPGNGGIPLLKTSQAIDSGGAECASADQLARPPVDGNHDGKAACDIGAYEFTDTDGDGVPDDVDLCGIDVAIDNGSAGTISVGPWKTSLAPLAFGASSLWSKATASSTPRYAFETTLPPGDYEVFEWHSRFSTRTRKAPHSITHDDGVATIDVDQSVNGGRWNSLGAFAFAGLARVTITAIDRTQSTNADAVRFVCKSRRLPVAVIDAILPNPATEADELSFEGHAEGAGESPRFTWILDGEIVNPSDRFTIGRLLAGTYTVDFRVEDSFGVSSRPAVETLVVNPLPCNVDQILEAGGPGTSSTGSWKLSSAPGAHGSASYWVRNPPSASSPPTYTFATTLPPGFYEVSEWHTKWPTRTKSARVDITFENNTGNHVGKTLSVDQSVNGAQWNLLGVFFFAGSTSVTITAIDRDLSTNADAVRFRCAK